MRGNVLRVRSLLMFSFAALSLAAIVGVYAVLPADKGEVFPALALMLIMVFGLASSYVYWLFLSSSSPYAMPVKILIGITVIIFGVRSMVLGIGLLTGLLLTSTFLKALAQNAVILGGAVSVLLAYGLFAKSTYRSDLSSISRNSFVSYVDQTHRSVLSILPSYRGAPLEGKLATLSDNLVRLKQLLSFGNPELFENPLRTRHFELMAQIGKLGASLTAQMSEDLVDRLGDSVQELYRDVKSMQQGVGRH